MINTRSIALIIAALVIAGITAFLARSLVTTDGADQAPVVQQAANEAQVLVINKNINIGSFLKREDLEWQSWPDDNINVNYTQKTSEAEADGQIGSIAGSVAKSPLVAGEPIINGRIVMPGDRGFMAAVLKPGNRAVSINIDPKSGLSGFIFPGDMVDVLLTHSVQEAGGGGNRANSIQATETVLTDIRVLAIDTQMTNETNTPTIGKVATFEVSPKQAEKVALMSRMGELSLSLRSLAHNADDPELDRAIALNNSRRKVTYADEVSSVIAEQTGTGLAGGSKQVVTVIRAGSTQELSFTDPDRNNR